MHPDNSGLSSFILRISEDWIRATVTMSRIILGSETSNLCMEQGQIGGDSGNIAGSEAAESRLWELLAQHTGKDARGNDQRSLGKSA